jgi:hypothetical protein
VPLLLALVVGHVHGRSPEDKEDVLHRREATGISITAVLLGLAILRGGAAIVFLEHVALLEGVVDQGLEHVVVHGVYSYQTSYGFASGQIPHRSQGTLLPLSGEPKVSNPWNNVQRKDSI